MKAWTERPKEEAHLFNPAFCASLFSMSAREYAALRTTAIPFPITFLILPILLHKATRNALPPNARTSMAAWIQGHMEAKIGFYERMMSLKPHTSEALIFGCHHQLLSLTNTGDLESLWTNADASRATRLATDDARECLMKAKLIGKWFAGAGDTSTAMAIWGVKP